MHQPPSVPNHGRPGRGPRLVLGLALAVEPMVVAGGPDSVVLDDDWTVATADGSWAAHFEHTFTLTERGAWVLTAIDGGRERLEALGYTVDWRTYPMAHAVCAQEIGDLRHWLGQRFSG